jgi:hypothetical protein
LLSINGCGGEKKNFKITGEVVDSVSKQRLQGVEIFIVDKQISSNNQPIAMTGQDGEYTINFTIKKAASLVTTKEDGGYNVTIPSSRIKGKETLPLKFVKKAYEDSSKDFSLSDQTKTVEMKPEWQLTGWSITVSAYKKGEASDPIRNLSPFPYLKVFYAHGEKEFQQAKYPTNEDGKLELSVPGTVEDVRLKIDDNPADKWILQEPKEQTARPIPGGQPEVTFVFREARDRTIDVTCTDDKTGQPISGVGIVINDKIVKRTNSSGVASLVVPALPAQTVEISCRHSEYYDKNDSVTIKEGIDNYPKTIRLDPKIYVTITVADVTYSTKVPVSGVYVYANRDRIGPTNAEGTILRQVVRGFSQSSSIRIDDRRWEITGTPQISRPTPERHEYQVNVQARFIPQTVRITTLDRESGEQITVDEAVLLDRNNNLITTSSPTISRGEVLISVSHPTQKVRLSKRRYGTKTVEAQNQTVQMSRSLVTVIVRVKNKGGNEVSANVKIGTDEFRSTERRAYSEGRYDVIVTSDEKDPNGIKKYVEWKGYEIEVRPNQAGNFILDVTLLDNYIERAKAAALRGEYRTAANEYKEYVDLAEDLAKKGQFDRHSSEYIGTLFELGRIYGDKLVERKKAIDMFERVVILRGNYAMAHYNLGFYAYFDGQYDKAHEAFRNVIANELNVGADILLRTKYYYASACDKLYKDKNEEVYKNDALQYCKEFQDAKPKLVQGEGEKDIQYFQEDLHKIYKRLTGNSLYTELNGK